MKKVIFILILLIIFGSFSYFIVNWMGWGMTRVTSKQFVKTLTETLDSSPSGNVSYTVEEFATGLEVPWSMVFTSQTRMLVSERPGRIRVIENGRLNAVPLHVFSDVSVGGEEGLMSLAVDPNYLFNKFIYVSRAYEKGSDMYVKVVRFVDNGNNLGNETIVIDNIPAARFHAGCRIAFGPDGKLYITTGDATDRNLAQQLDSLAGKILRITSDGSIPVDNPIPGSPIWSHGHRNPQGIAWDSNGELYATEHGPSVFDGPAGGDEVNHIIKGENYGWPLVSHEKKRDGTVAPLAVFTPAEAPGSLLIYDSNVFPQFQHNLFFGAIVGEGLMRVVVDPNNPDIVISYEKLFDGEYGRIRDVATDPSGLIYFSTSNRDGRGDPVASDDRIFRLRPN